jgi:hypothetical protein
VRNELVVALDAGALAGVEGHGDAEESCGKGEEECFHSWIDRSRWRVSVRAENGRRVSPSLGLGPTRQDRWNNEALSAPLPTVAQSDYFQNGLILPRIPKNLELLLRDVDAKGYLDIELVYRLIQKESLGSVKQKIVRKIQRNESAFCFEDLVREALEAV